MLLTEEQAKDKWCPFVKGVEFPRIQDRGAPDRCVGSYCMAWRWRLDLPDQPKSSKLGYCGLSGRPE